MMKLTNMIRGLEGHAPAQELAVYWEHDAGTLKYWRASSNFVYQFRNGGELFYLRFIHEEDRMIDQIEAELNFILYLLDAGYEAAAPVRSRNGNWMETIVTASGRYYGVVFRQAQGVHVPIGEMTDSQFEAWGRSLARLHRLSESYAPAGAARGSWSDALDFVAAVLRQHPEEHDAVRAMERMRNWLAELPSDSEQTGLIHYDFETDNVFYAEGDSRYSAIDFDDAMYHWYAMDITSALTDLIEENDDRASRSIGRFIEGYRSIRDIEQRMIELMPRFRQFADLYMFARLLRAMDGMVLANAPDWAVRLKDKLLGFCERFRESLRPGPDIELKPVTADNWHACAKLEVTGRQQSLFPVPAVYWLAESAYCGFTPLAVHADGELAGLAVYALDPGNDSYWIMAFMIDRNYQHKGLGRAGMNALIRHMIAAHGCSAIMLGHRPENEPAARLYESLGFAEVDRDDREVVRKLVVPV